MRRQPTSFSRSLLVPALAVLAASAIGCGSSSKTTSSSTAAPASPPASTSPPTSTPSASTSTPAGGGGLSGKWSGKYSGAYSGTFSLVWTQSGSALNGKITLSAPPQTLGINGSVNGSAIQFGTVGGGVAYTGSVSGNSMSGTYQSPKGGGSWSATKP